MRLTPRGHRFGLMVSLLAAVANAQAGEPPPTAKELPLSAEQAVDFVRDIQPLLAKRCHSCHGAEKAEASLRLDTKDEAFEGGVNGPAFTPGKSTESRLIQFVSGVNDEGTVMPPDGQPLSAAEIGLLRAWIDQGALWPDDAAEARKHADHWSFQPVRRLEPPVVRHTDHVRNPVDAFVLAKLETLGIEPAAEADRATLIRRLSFDLIGLPPTPAEVEEFVADPRGDAYELLVDRLLASAHYGERWGRHWLDLARYADSDGYEKDTGRPHAWRWRNWVIDALNRDLPFDQFTIRQLAGDLLADADDDARIATGFHRNTLTNREGGADQEEDRVKKTVDRVNTTGSVWLGLTIGCAQCHSHKYDPLAQREYYGLFAFFNSVDEVEIPAPLAEQLAAYRQAKQAFDAQHATFTAAIKRYEQDTLPMRRSEWERSLDLDTLTIWTILPPSVALSTAGATLAVHADGSVLASGPNPPADTYTLSAKTDLKGITAIRLEVLADPALPSQGPGRTPHGNFVLSELRVTSAPAAGGETRPVLFDKASADFAQGGFPAEHAFDGDAKTGWAIVPQVGRDHVAVFEVKEPFGDEGETLLTITLDQQHGLQHTIGKLRLSVTTSKGAITATGISSELAAILARPEGERSADEQDAVARYHRAIDPGVAALERAAAEHAKQAPADPGSLTRAQALAEVNPPRSTRVMIRGDFLRPGAEVEPHVPAVLPRLVARGPRPDRLDLSQWLVDPANPLTARVTVNRVWMKHFGRGLVATDDDFGTQGEPPTHPELLDWLASEFIARGWSLKSLHKLIVTSSTYRQSSAVRPELIERDPNNLLLARQRRLRVEAEAIRDLSLAASGLLNRKVGGPSVRPKQPAGISELTYSGSAHWDESQGADRYRRGLYTWFQRTSPYPMLLTFDAPDSNVACTRRERSNTPLQALTLLNDPVFFECAQALARRIVVEAPCSAGGTTTLAERLQYAFRLCLGRAPTSEELADLAELYAGELALAEADPPSAAALAGSVARPEEANPAELAAWIMVGRTLLNLDEFITRE
ncbi:MAG TPA: PSD1 and planctomycete cytochrome C domain-containing protein [Pirellulales bacterium]|nr:PSD1 and planctomycete cytochrome C domain-containing protein [Pirellulales bacterium]